MRRGEIIHAQWIFRIAGRTSFSYCLSLLYVDINVTKSGALNTAMVKGRHHSKTVDTGLGAQNLGRATHAQRVVVLKTVVLVMMLVVPCSRPGGRERQDTVQRSRTDQSARTVIAQDPLLHPHQLRHESNVGTHAGSLGQNVVIGLVERPLKLSDQVGDRCSHRSRLAGLAVHINWRIRRSSYINKNDTREAS